ncbi:MAG: hypothetical protein SF029_19385 [bacterium]|nr:hypothetical protein [bacterium]
MLGELDAIDWEPYREAGLKSPDFPTLIRMLCDDNWLKRKNAADHLDSQMEYSFMHAKNDLPFVLIPFLWELLQADEVSDKALILGLLRGLLDYHTIEPLAEQDYRVALRYRDAVCAGAEIYQSMLATADEALRDEIAELFTACEDNVVDA